MTDETSTQAVARRSNRFWAYVIDQVILGIISFVVFVGVFSTQTLQISNAVNAFFGDPLWKQSKQLSSDEFDVRLENLMSSEKVSSSVQQLAYPLAFATSVTLLISAAYYIISTKRWGATLGKRLVRIKVHSLEGDLPDWWQSTLRYFALVGLGTFSGVVTTLDLVVNKAFFPSNIAVEILSTLLSQATWVLTMISVIMIFARPDRRGLHDQLAHTIVRSSAPAKSTS